MFLTYYLPFLVLCFISRMLSRFQFIYFNLWTEPPFRASLLLGESPIGGLLHITGHTKISNNATTRTTHKTNCRSSDLSMGSVANASLSTYKSMLWALSYETFGLENNIRLHRLTKPIRTCSMFMASRSALMSRSCPKFAILRKSNSH